MEETGEQVEETWQGRGPRKEQTGNNKWTRQDSKFRRQEGDKPSQTIKA